MTSIRRFRPEDLVSSSAFSHVAVMPPGARTIHVGGQNSADASVDDVVKWTVLFVAGVDVGAAYGVIAADLALMSGSVVSMQ